MNLEQIGVNIETLRERMLRAEARSGRAEASVALMAVSKFQPLEAMEAAVAAGIRLFGENRVQEALQKIPSSFRSDSPGIRLDFIGNLQTNKAGKALDFFDSIQSVGSMELLEALLARSARAPEGMRLYFELRTGEESKSGFPGRDELFSALERFSAEPGASRRFKAAGIMTMAPYTDSELLQRRAFAKAREVLEAAKKRFDHLGMEELSMGMSSDFEAAIEEGSTMIRIGTAIFGQRS